MYRIYWNLHKRCYSIQIRDTHTKRWRVWLYADEVVADNVTFDVRALGRARVRREGRKNVHAYLIAESVSFPNGAVLRSTGAELLGTEPERIYPDREITYNPYRHESFVTVGDERERPVEWAYAAHLTTNRLVHSHRKPIIRAEGVAFSREEAA